jgi:hypothetical protein
MKIFRKAVTNLGGIFLAALLIAALAPKATRGVAAALVQVTNTASNAVPTQDGPGSFPYGAILCNEVGNSNCGSTQQGLRVPLTTSTGAAVNRLVIEDLSAFCDIDQGDQIVPFIRVPLPVDNSTAGQGTLLYGFPVALVGNFFAFSQSPARIYADPGAEISSGLAGTFAGNNASCNMYLTGHLESK